MEDRSFDARFLEGYFISSIESKCLGDLVTGFTLVEDGPFQVWLSEGYFISRV